jgi:hypothetical protein
MDALISTISKHSEITGTLCTATIEFSSGVGFEFFAISKLIIRGLRDIFAQGFFSIDLTWFSSSDTSEVTYVMFHCDGSQNILKLYIAAHLSLQHMWLLVESYALQMKATSYTDTFVISLKIKILRRYRNVVCVFILSLFLLLFLNICVLLLRSLVFPTFLSACDEEKTVSEAAALFVLVMKRL